jgi:hypothetical protein
MKAILYYCSSADYVGEDSDALMDYLVGYKELELDRIPNTGEVITIATHGVTLEGKVTQVYTNINEPHKNIKEEAWGVRYGIAVNEWEIVDYYDREEATEYREKAKAWRKRFRHNDDEE